MEEIGATGVADEEKGIAGVICGEDVADELVEAVVAARRPGQEAAFEDIEEVGVTFDLCGGHGREIGFGELGLAEK